MTAYDPTPIQASLINPHFKRAASGECLVFKERIVGDLVIPSGWDNGVVVLAGGLIGSLKIGGYHVHGTEPRGFVKNLTVIGDVIGTDAKRKAVHAERMVGGRLRLKVDGEAMIGIALDACYGTDVAGLVRLPGRTQVSQGYGVQLNSCQQVDAHDILGIGCRYIVSLDQQDHLGPSRGNSVRRIKGFPVGGGATVDFHRGFHDQHFFEDLAALKVFNEYHAPVVGDYEHRNVGFIAETVDDLGAMRDHLLSLLTM